VKLHFACVLLLLIFSPKILANFEVGKVDNVTDQFQTIMLNGSFLDPVVVAGPGSHNDQEPGVVIVNNITPGSFDVRFSEWNYLDGSHGAETVSYMVVERGTTVLPSGATIQAGTAPLGARWFTQRFSTPFSSVPLLLTTVSSEDFEGTVAPSINRLSAVRFNTRYWQEEQQLRAPRDAEQLNWLAISQGNDDGSSDGVAWETQILYTDERFRQANFDANYADPCVLADINSPTSNPVTVRARNLSGNSVELFAQEEQSKDIETVLGNEKIGIFVSECAAGDTQPPDWGDTVLIVDGSSNMLQLDWSPGATDDVMLAGYSVVLNGVTMGNTTSTEFLIASLQPDTNYQLTINALDTAGNASSIEGEFVTPVDSTEPQWDTTQLVVNEISSTAVTLSWAPGAFDDNGISEYTVSVDGEIVGNTSNTMFALADLLPESDYAATVVAKDVSGNVSPALPVEFSTLAAPDTTAPQWGDTSLQLIATALDSLTVSWVPGATDDSDNVSYRVEVDGVVVQSLAATELTITPLLPQTMYDITIVAIDSAGNESSISSSYSTDDLPPDEQAPNWGDTALSFSGITTDSLLVDWAPGATDTVGVTGYEVLLDGSSVSTTSTTSMLLTTLDPSTTYQIEIVARDAAGNSEVLVGSVTTLEAPPVNTNVVETGMALGITDQFTTINFDSFFSDPVVVAGPASSFDSDPGVVVVDNVTSTSFDVRFREWNYQDGFHEEETLFYMVVERGTTALPSGTIIKADTAQIGPAWSLVQYGDTFAANPVLLTSIASASDSGTIAPRVTSLGRSSFRTRFWLEEGNSVPHAAEELNWIAIEPGSDDGGVDGFAWETITFRTDEKFKQAPFNNSYDNVCITGDINSLTPNPSTLRARNITETSVELRLHEEQSKDPEQLLGLETVALFVSECIAVDEELPTWPTASLDVVNATPFALELLYGGAVDNVGVDYYEIFQNGVSIGTSQTQLFSVTDLEPSTAYEFRVEAIDLLGNQSVDGPFLALMTESAPQGRIEGSLWVDANLDTLRNSDESGVPSAIVTLALDDGDVAGVYDSSNTIVDTTTTNADGSYAFEYLTAGSYVVVPTTFAGYLEESPSGSTPVLIGADEIRSGIDFAFSVNVNSTSGTPFGVFAQISRIESLLPQFGVVHFHLGTPEEATYYLDLARATNTKMIISLTLAQHSRNANGTLNLNGWKDEVDTFADFDFSPWINDGTLIAHYLLDEPKAANSWGGRVIHNQTLDDMAEYSKQYWPTLPTTVRMQPTKLVLHAGGLNRPIPGWQWNYLDIAWAQYNFRQVPVVGNYIAAERQSAIDQDLGLIWGLQAMVGGNGSSGLHPQPPFNTSRWTMSADEIVNYASEMLATEFGCAFVVFRYDRFEETHFERPEIAQAMADARELATTYQPGVCGLRD